jgi:hypothetical protein
MSIFNISIEELLGFPIKAIEEKKEKEKFDMCDSIKNVIITRYELHKKTFKELFKLD